MVATGRPCPRPARRPSARNRRVGRRDTGILNLQAAGALASRSPRLTTPRSREANVSRTSSGRKDREGDSARYHDGHHRVSAVGPGRAQGVSQPGECRSNRSNAFRISPLRIRRPPHPVAAAAATRPSDQARWQALSRRSRLLPRSHPLCAQVGNTRLAGEAIESSARALGDDAHGSCTPRRGGTACPHSRARLDVTVVALGHRSAGRGARGDRRRPAGARRDAAPARPSDLRGPGRRNGGVLGSAKARRRRGGRLVDGRAACLGTGAARPRRGDGIARSGRFTRSGGGRGARPGRRRSPRAARWRRWRGSGSPAGRRRAGPRRRDGRGWRGNS